jgi:hypothetical protein
MGEDDFSKIEGTIHIPRHTGLDPRTIVCSLLLHLVNFGHTICFHFKWDLDVSHSRFILYCSFVIRLRAGCLIAYTCRSKT